MKRKRFHRALWTILILTALGLLLPRTSLACTRVLWNDNQLAVLVGRTMDWPESTQPVLTVFPRGVSHDGSRLGADIVVKENGLKWTSKYGSLITSVYGLGTADGFNEQGLAAHLLILDATDFGVRNPDKPGLQAALLPQYLLDNAATVTEALALLDKIQPVMIQAHGAESRVHVALEDVEGDSAIIEYLDGKCVVHHGREFQVMTNDPRYEQQLEHLKALHLSHPGGAPPPPGNGSSEDRFVRASYSLALLPKPKTEREGVTDILSVMRKVSAPLNTPEKSSDDSDQTEYRTVCDLTHKRYYFELATSPGLIWADLGKLNLAPGAPVMALSPQNPRLSGDVTKKFKKAAQPPF